MSFFFFNLKIYFKDEIFVIRFFIFPACKPLLPHPGKAPTVALQTNKSLQSLWHSSHQEMKSISFLLVWEEHGAVLNNQGWQKWCWLSGWILNGDVVPMLFVRSLELGSRCIRSPTTLRPVCCEGAMQHGKTICPCSFGISILSHPSHTADSSRHTIPALICSVLSIHVFPSWVSNTVEKSASHQTHRGHVLSKITFILAVQALDLVYVRQALHLK